MRTLLIVLPGLADSALTALRDRTPLEAAEHPALDELATRGRLGTARLIPGGASGRSASGSIVGLPVLLGYDAARLDLRRGPLEAAGLGVALAPGDLALRLNFVSTFDGRLVDTRAGHVTDPEAALLLDALRRIDTSDLRLRLHAGFGYRHLAVIEGGARLDLRTVPPQELLGRPWLEHAPEGRDAAPLVRFLREAARILPGHEVNRVRVDLGENPADAAWLWGEGTDVELPPRSPRFGARAALIGAAPLVRGLAAKARMSCPPLERATADEQSNLAGKAAAALVALEANDFVCVHAAAVNEASRSGDVRRKVAALERVDRELVAPLAQWVAADLSQRRLLVTSDHATSVETRARLDGAVPFALWGAGLVGVRARRFTEDAARAADLQLDSAGALLDWFLEPGARTATA